MSATRPRVLLLGDGAVPTGFARALHGALAPLAERYEFHQLAINYFGEPHDWPWRLYPASLGGDRHGVQRLEELLARVRPALVFALNDPWVIAQYMPVLAASRGRVPAVAWCPVDGLPVAPAFIEPMMALERVVACTAFGRDAFDEGFRAARRARPELAAPALEVIPHGVDARLFFPAPERDVETSLRTRRRAARRLLCEGSDELDGAFLVLNANRNQPRKRIDVTMRGFAQFAEGKPDSVKLYLHMGVKDLGWDLVALARRLGIEHRLVVSSTAGKMPFFTSQELNRIYNACDVGVNTSMSEGWGLVSFEHAATGAAQVVPRHSACAELWRESAELLEPVATVLSTEYLHEEKLIAPEALAAALERLYRDPALLRERSLAAYRNATRPEYRWESVASRWGSLFDALLG